MAGVTVWSRDIASEVNKMYKCNVLPNLKGYQVSLEIGGDILDVLEKEEDYRTPALMVEDAQDACEETCSNIVKFLKDLDKKCAKEPKVENVIKLVKGVNSDIDKEVKGLGSRLKTVPKARWDKWVKTKKQYKSYKWSCVGKVALGTVGVVASGLAIAAAVPTGGATLALGIVGGVRSGMKLFDVGAKMWAEAETVQKKVMFSIGVLQKIYGDAKGKSNKAGAKEAGLSLLNSILPMELGPTVSVLKGDIELWGNKLDGIDVSADKKTKFAMGLLKDTDNLEKALQKSKSKDVAKVLAKLDKARKALDKALIACTNESARVRDGRRAIEPIEKEVLPELKSKQPKWTAVFDKVLPAVVSIGLAGGAAGLGFKEAEDALDYFHEAADLLLEVGETVKELAED